MRCGGSGACGFHVDGLGGNIPEVVGGATPTLGGTAAADAAAEGVFVIFGGCTRLGRTLGGGIAIAVEAVELGNPVAGGYEPSAGATTGGAALVSGWNATVVVERVGGGAAVFFVFFFFAGATWSELAVTGGTGGAGMMAGGADGVNADGVKLALGTRDVFGGAADTGVATVVAGAGTNGAVVTAADGIGAVALNWPGVMGTNVAVAVVPAPRAALLCGARDPLETGGAGGGGLLWPTGVADCEAKFV